MTFDDKRQVSRYWNDRPCGSWLASEATFGTKEFFERTEAARYRREPFIRRFARFSEWTGQYVLEVGCGIGTDLSMFARHGAHVFGVDLTYNGAALTNRRLRYHDTLGIAMVGDSELLPFETATFDLVYSWGVIHHTPNTTVAAQEIVRVAKPGGQIIVMIYNRRSLVALQAYVMYGLLKGRPGRPLADIMSSHLESPGTKAYTQAEAREMFSSLEQVTVTPVMTIYDLRIGRNRFLPEWACSLVPQRFGYFMIIQGRKPADAKPSPKVAQTS
jgi:SAM-dependent methyltransferase